MHPHTRDVVPAGEHTFHPVVGEELTFVRQMWYDDQASRALGMEVLEVALEDGLGRCRLRMPVRDLMVNGHNIAHGGYIFTFCDSAFAVACNAKGILTVAAGCDINYLTSAMLGDVLIADAVERVTYGRNGITDVSVTRESDGELIAIFRGRSRAIARAATPTSE